MIKFNNFKDGEILKTVLNESLKADGVCYEASYQYFNRNYKDGMKLVHGLVDGQGPLEGIRYNHAWIEFNGVVIDMTLPPKVQKSLPVVLYRSIGNISKKETFEYSQMEVFEKVQEYKTYGPWEKILLKNKY